MVECGDRLGVSFDGMIGARRTNRLEELAKEIRSSGGTVEFRALDVTDRADVEAFARATVDAFGSIDVLINNAGVMPLSLMSSLKVEEWDRMRSKKMNGPTSRRWRVGRARRTWKPPISLVRGMIRFSIASQAKASPGRGSLPGKKDMAHSDHKGLEPQIASAGLWRKGQFVR